MNSLEFGAPTFVGTKNEINVVMTSSNRFPNGCLSAECLGANSKIDLKSYLAWTFSNKGLQDFLAIEVRSLLSNSLFVNKRVATIVSKWNIDQRNKNTPNYVQFALLYSEHF